MTPDPDTPRPERLRHDYLRRLPDEFYRGTSAVHWSMTLQDRSTGWLSDLHHSRLRESLLHTLTRYRLLCPVYCLMPDHAHFLWLGLSAESDSLRAASFFRRAWNDLLRPLGHLLQKQAYDHVLPDEERNDQDAFAAVAHYLAQNPVRAGLVDTANDWPHWGALAPGYPRLDPREDGFWENFWRIRDALTA